MRLLIAILVMLSPFFLFLFYALSALETATASIGVR